MRKMTSLLLAAAMMLGAATTAFAASVTPEFSATSVAAGDDVTVTVKLDEAMDDITMYQYDLYFDANLFTLKSSTANPATVSELKSDANGSFHSISYVDPTSEGQTIAAGTIATLVFTAKADLTDEQTGAFELVKTYVWDSSFADTGDAAVENGDMDITVSTEPEDTSKDESSKDESSKPNDNKTESGKNDTNKGSSSSGSSSSSSSSHNWGEPLNNSANADKDAAADKAPSADNNNANPGTGR